MISKHFLKFLRGALFYKALLEMPERSRKHGGARHKSVHRSTARKLKKRQLNRKSRGYNKTMFLQPIRKFESSAERGHAANMNALVGAMNAAHVSARSATRQRLLSQKKSQANPFKLAALKKAKLSAVNELNSLFKRFGKAKFSSSVRKPRGKKNVSMASRSSARVAARQSQQ